MKTSKLSAIAALMGMCDFAKMERQPKKKAYKAYRELKEAAKVYDSAVQDASEKFKPKGFDEKLAKVKLGATIEEARAFEEMSRKYNEDVVAVTQTIGDAEVEPKFEKLSEDEFFDMVDSNEKLTAEQIAQLEDALCEKEEQKKKKK